MPSKKSSTSGGLCAVGILAALAIAIIPTTSANAATTIDGPVDLGTAAPFSVLGASTVTNTGLSVLNGDLGLSPGTSVTGFPPGIVNGTQHVTDQVAALAQGDLTTAYNSAAALTPTTSGLTDLVGLTLVPGVYAGGALSLSGTLTLAGAADSVWVFQAASTLITASASNIVVTGGATSCNVFWQVSDSATLGSGSNFVGTVMANQSISATTTAQITGRLLARTGAVTLDTNLITAPTGCPASGVVTTSPVISNLPAVGTVGGVSTVGTVGTPYSSTVAASGTPTPTFAVTGGTLPTGLSLDSATGTISGTPTTPGTYTFSITASNGTPPDATTTFSIVIAPATPASSRSVRLLAATGAADDSLLPIGGALAFSGLLLLAFAHRRRPVHRA